MNSSKNKAVGDDKVEFLMLVRQTQGWGGLAVWCTELLRAHVDRDRIATDLISMDDLDDPHPKVLHIDSGEIWCVCPLCEVIVMTKGIDALTDRSITSSSLTSPGMICPMSDTTNTDTQNAANTDAAAQFGPTGNPADLAVDLGPGAQPYPPGQEPHVTAETLGGVNPTDAPAEAQAAAETRLAETVPGETETVPETITVDVPVDPPADPAYEAPVVAAPVAEPVEGGAPS